LDKRLLNPESTLIRMRPLTQLDVPFVFEIRHSERAHLLNPTSPDIAVQYSYYENYLERFKSGDEIYYMIHDKKSNLDVGVVRMTRILASNTFGWEALVMKPESTPGCAIDVATSIFSMGFEWLNKEECGPWIVPMGNKRVMKMHEMMEIARKVGEDESGWFVSAKRADFQAKIEKLRNRGFGRIHDNW